MIECLRCKIRGARIRAPRVPATRAESSHLKKSRTSPRESLCLSCHVRMRKGEKRERGEKVRGRRGKGRGKKRERGKEREIQRKKKRREKEGSAGTALSRSCIPRSWKTHCLGCTHTGSGGCVASVKYRRSDSVESACTSKRCSSRADSSGPSPSAGESERERERHI